jgi:DNA-binding NtrC family response regulator
VVERLAILVPGPEVQPGDVAAVLPRPSTPPTAGPVYEDDDTRGLRDRLDAYEKELISGALHAAGGNVAEAGRRLQTDRANLYRRMRRLGIRD